MLRLGGVRWRLIVLVAIVAATYGVDVAPAAGNRSVPVGIYNVNNSALTQGPSRMYALRFVLDRPARIHRFFSGMNWEGVYVDENGQPAPAEIRSAALVKGSPSPPPPSNLPAGWTPGSGRLHYAHGNGGTIRARLVAMRPDGTPDLSRVLAEETYSALARYKQVKAEWGFSGRAGMVYSSFGGVEIPAGVPHFVIYQNVHPDPRNNFVSLNSPVVDERAAGPNGRNTLDPGAGGAIAGLDPREAVAWSTDGGVSWGWGRQVGSGSVPGDYAGSGDDGVRLPWYAWQETSGAQLRSNQPYYAYTAKGSYTLRVKSAPRATTLTEAGGYGPGGASVGVVTVRNLRTGAVGRTAPLGSGLAKGALSPTVEVAAGDSYEISNSGSVAKAEGDLFLQKMGLVGPGRTPYETVGNEYDRAELFALPHPWFAGGGAEPGPGPGPEPPSSGPGPGPTPPSGGPGQGPKPGTAPPAGGPGAGAGSQPGGSSSRPAAPGRPAKPGSAGKAPRPRKRSACRGKQAKQRRGGHARPRGRACPHKPRARRRTPR